MQQAAKSKDGKEVGFSCRMKHNINTRRCYKLLSLVYQEAAPQEGQPAAVPASSSPTAPPQQQTLKQLASTAPTTVSTPTAPAGSTSMNGPTQTAAAASPPQPVQPAQPVQQPQPTVQPVLKPPPQVVRPRPQPFTPSPFTRHMSLRYKSTPMSLGPLRDTSSKGYETLLEESQPPKLPQTVDALNIHGNQPQPMNYPGGFVPLQSSTPQVVSASPGQPSMYNGLHSNSMNTTQSFGSPAQTQPFGAQTVQQNPWSPPVSQLKRTPSDAEKWLESAENLNKANSANQGLLTTHNPFATTQNSAISGTWTTDMNKSLPAVQQTNQNAWGPSKVPSVPEEDDFASLASRHTGSPVSSPRGSTSSNPFSQGSQVYWV